MRSEKIKESSLSRLCCFLLLTSYFLFFISLSACGRRGDPVAIIPPAHEVTGNTAIADGNEEGAAVKKENAEREEITIIAPNAPEGLVALYTEKSIILTWDEIRGQEIRTYNIYRSQGTADNYELIGDARMPAFTDKEIERKTRYYYRITAVGPLESSPSTEINILTEVP